MTIWGVDQNADEEIKGNEEAARYVGVSVNTWRPYVARNQAPRPDRREIQGGHAVPVWKRSTLDKWKANRPGPGARTDLRGKQDGNASIEAE